jgi:hypothetical protein
MIGVTGCDADVLMLHCDIFRNAKKCNEALPAAHRPEIKDYDRDETFLK